MIQKQMSCLVLSACPPASVNVNNADECCLEINVSTLMILHMAESVYTLSVLCQDSLDTLSLCHSALNPIQTHRSRARNVILKGVMQWLNKNLLWLSNISLNYQSAINF